MQTRRTFIKTTAAAFSLSGPFFESGKKRKAVLLCSSWQTFNIGDIAHTPGVLTIFEKFLPGVDVILWPHDVGNGVEEMLRKRFPGVAIVKNAEDIKNAFKRADFLVHGSGPSLVGRSNILRWKEETGKPYGIYGITFPGIYAARGAVVTASRADIDILNEAEFAFFRDSPSLDFAIKSGVTCPIMEFGPDGTFAVDLNNDRSALLFMKENNLEEGKFLCCIPRYRFTENWLAKGKNRPFNQSQMDYNIKMKEHDNAPLRAAITEVTRQTSMKVLLCPEDETQVALGKSLILDNLPEDVKKRVVWRNKYWLTDEALSTYRLSAGLFGLEMHSPIICIGQGIPAIVCRFYEQTSKGIMWKDIGLEDWLFDMDNPSEIGRIVPTVLSIARDQKNARKKALMARSFVLKRQKETMAILKSCLEKTP